MVVLEFDLPQLLGAGAAPFTIIGQSDAISDTHVQSLQQFMSEYRAPESSEPYTAISVIRLDRHQFAVVHYRSELLRFHACILDRRQIPPYAIDPERFTQEITIDWQARGTLPLCRWSCRQTYERVEDLQNILKDGNSPLLLGALQALIDGGKIVFVRPTPDVALVRNLWRLLPYSTRDEMQYTTFAGSTALPSQILVVPTLDAVPAGYLTEDNALDYPEGRYEKSLQIAVEAGDQAEVDRLLHRRSSLQTLRLAGWLVLGALILSAIMRILFGPVAKIG